ncbi:Lrp/AsnC family transcriptional regulator [Mycolicibacterium helvum]|uniref:AsnC family transcriptional regulator n=1 Tax=Mycolicibacterium helvum TaxID=1534349 RepID=A0A7I7T7Y1_9MYCO|nr:Lrp/AsnC family transcriptional regulator [Mycolicibacterium helvum]BBY64903.1 AsnC family transcriptional regulator [Mycolicibacterium helvum]
MISLDRLDVELLRILSTDARTGTVELSSVLGIARNTVASRLRKLEEAGLLIGYQPRLDLAEAGIGVQAFIAVEIEQGRLGAVVDDLAAIPQVLEVHATTGREDLLVRVGSPSQADLQALIEHVVALDGVVHTSTTLALTTPLPFRAIPLLEYITRDTGWGRSTPAPLD